MDRIHRLYQAILDRKAADPSGSRTAKLLAQGRGKMAQKLGEEAVEVVIDAVRGDRTAVIAESADLIYHLVAIWSELRIHPTEVWAEMDRREKLLGLAEKLPKKRPPEAA